MDTATINLKLSSSGILKPSIPTKESLAIMTIVLLCVQLSNESSKIFYCVLIAFYLCEIENVNSSNNINDSSAASVDLKFRIKSPLTIWLKNSLKSYFETSLFISRSIDWKSTSFMPERDDELCQLIFSNFSSITWRNQWIHSISILRKIIWSAHFMNSTGKRWNRRIAKENSNLHLFAEKLYFF